MPRQHCCHLCYIQLRDEQAGKAQATRRVLLQASHASSGGTENQVHARVGAHRLAQLAHLPA